MTNVTDIINYYVNLLIIQYHNRPKAQATIALLADVMLASGVITDVLKGFDIDTAVGKQLDIIGKYVGIDRYYSEDNLADFFGLVTYSEYLSLPSSPPVFGACTYATFTLPAFNGTLTYAQVITSNNALSDSDFRALIKFQILVNNSDFNFADFDAFIFNSFEGVRMESNGIMSIVYFLTPPYSKMLIAALFKGMLPHPMAVGTQIVNDVTGKMFSLANYAGYESPFGSGFSTYSNYATLPGDVLTYDQISEG